MSTATAPLTPGEQQRFGDELPNQAPTAGTERVAQRQLARARGGLGEQEVRRVDAGDEQQDADRAQQDVQRGAHLGRLRRLQRNRRRASQQIVVLLGRLPHDPLRDGGKVGRRLDRADADPQAADAGVVVRRAAGIVRIEFAGQPQVRLGGEIEPLRQDADDRVDPVLDAQLPRRQVTGRSKLFFPVAVARQQRRGGAGLVLSAANARPITG